MRDDMKRPVSREERLRSREFDAFTGQFLCETLSANEDAVRK